MRKKGLESYTTDELVEELQRRLDSVEKAREVLFGLPPLKARMRQTKRMRKVFASQISSLTNRIRHAKARNEDTTTLEKQLARVRAEHAKLKQ
jgi:hypothetical protein